VDNRRSRDHQRRFGFAELARDAAAADYSWSSIISGIVMSTPFSMAIASGDAGRPSGKVRQ